MQKSRGNMMTIKSLFRNEYGKQLIFKKMNEESGYLLVISIFILAVLTIGAAAISQISQTESGVVKNERMYFESFYEAESAAVKSIENYKDWNSALDRSATNGHKFELITGCGSGLKMMVVAVKIEDEDEKSDFTGDLSDFATKDLPDMRHIDDPLIDSGTGVTGKTKISRYAVTTEPNDGELQLQVGIYKYIPSDG